MPSIVKSVRLPNDSMMQKFVEKQSNFSNAIRYLVIKYCQVNGYDGIQDLSVLYKKLTEMNLYGSSDVANRVHEEPEKKIRPAVSSVPVKQAATSYETTGERLSTVAAPASDIPSCYQ